MEKKINPIGFLYWPLAVIAMVGAAFWIGRLSIQVENLQNNKQAIAANVPDGPTQPVAQPTPVPVAIDQIKTLFSENLVKFGDENRKVLFVQVFDPSCPYCQATSGKNPSLNLQLGPQFKLVSDGGSYVPPLPEMRKLVDAKKASLVWIYTSGHGNGEMGTKALYCAFEKGRFWQVEDLLLTKDGYDLLNNNVKNDKSKSGVLAQFLRKAMDPTEMKKCLDSGKYDDRLQADTSVASNLGVSGTPGFFINATRFAGAYSYDAMKSAVDEALK